MIVAIKTEQEYLFILDRCPDEHTPQVEDLKARHRMQSTYIEQGSRGAQIDVAADCLEYFV